MSLIEQVCDLIKVRPGLKRLCEIVLSGRDRKDNGVEQAFKACGKAV